MTHKNKNEEENQKSMYAQEILTMLSDNKFY